MKRNTLWIVLITLLFIAAMLALGGRSCELRDGHAVFAQEVTPDGYPICIRCDDPATCYVIPCPGDVTNTPQPSPTATRTPVATFYTPTIETTMAPTLTPSITPTIAPTSTPQPEGCWGTVAVPALNVRDAPYGNRLGQVFGGDTLAFDAKWLDVNGDWWWRFYWTPTETAWVASWLITVGDTADCSGLEDVTPVVRKSDLVVGFFSMPNGNVMEQVQAVGVAAGKGIVFGTHPYANASTCLQVMDAGGVCSYRHGNPDCPENIFQGDPRAAARNFMLYDVYVAEGVFQNYPGQIWIDPLNECNWGNNVEELSWWAYFLDEFITQAAARNWPPLHLPSLGPGYGDYLMFSTWRDVLNKLNDNGGMFAMHVYNPVSEWLCPFDEWLADRTLHNYEIMQELGIDVQIMVSEVGHGWGNTPPNIDDMACWVERTAQYPFVAQVYIWEVGRNFTWELANWEGKVIEFIQSLGGALWQ